MGLATGTKLGPYEIQSPLGAGGMGEVYRARDTRLGRDVAVKVLPERLGSSPDFRQRFEREARAISSLQHPHICVLHDIGRDEAAGEFLVMEFLEGETVAERLKRGKLPLQELLKIGMEMADALDKAHRKGVVHRDLKPGNIMLTQSGSKLMDFGLAKPAALGAAGGAGTAPLLSAAVTAEGASPASPITSAGVIVGTIQYMSPEQIEGKEADARSDIFAFGATLYEMATGVHAFPGRSQLSVASAILEKDPEPISKTQPLVPPALDRVVAQCLTKNPDDRFQSAHDVGLELNWISVEADSSRQELNGDVKSPLQPWRRALPWVLAVVLLTTTLLIALAYLRLRSLPAEAVRSSILPPANSVFDPAGGPAVISPDGRQLAFVARAPGGQDVLWVRPLDAIGAQLLASTDGASSPFWSPDSRFLGFFAGGNLKKIATSGGPAETLARVDLSRGGSWNRDGVIVFAPGNTGTLYRVSGSGGPAVPVTKLDSSLGETGHNWPQFLPDGRHFLFFVLSSTPEGPGTYIGSLDGGTPKIVLRGNTDALYAAPGYLLFVREQTLMAQAFDARRLELKGEPQPVAESVGVDQSHWIGDFSVSQTGALVYHPSSWQRTGGELLLFDRAGKPIRSLSEGSNFMPVFSPEGRRIALMNRDLENGKRLIWVYDLERNAKTRLTFTGPLDVLPTWSSDGSAVIFASNRKGDFGIYAKSADGSGTTHPLIENGATNVSPSASSDGRYLAYESRPPGAASFGIWILPLLGDRTPFTFVQNAFNEGFPQFAPNGKWLAYNSDESGRHEVYIVPFPSGNGKRLVSIEGGRQPRWRKDGRELYYLSPGNEIMAVEITEHGATLEIGKPRVLFQAHPVTIPGFVYDISRDGKEFVVSSVSQDPQANAAPATLVENWPALLKKQ